jgi:ribosomal-protein-serine acetyltransferase
MESGSGLQLAVTVQDRIVGVAGFNSVDPANRVGSIGYWLSERHQGQGLMTRAVRALVALGFDELELNRIEIQVAKANARSRTIPIRLGFRFEGVRSQAERFRDRYVDLEVYALLARDRDG